jgi:hypothetical protein
VIDRNNVANVLERVMTKSPELITRDLPRWIADHGFDQNPLFYSESVRKQAFQYLASFATESVHKDALSIVERNEHYKSEFSCYVLLSSGFHPS